MRENRQCQQPAWNDAVSSALPPSNAERTAAHVTRCAPEQAQQPRIAQAVPRKTVPKKPRSRAAQQIEHARAHAKAAAKASASVVAQQMLQSRHADSGRSRNQAVVKEQELVSDLGNNHFVIRFGDIDDPHADPHAAAEDDRGPECHSGSGAGSAETDLSNASSFGSGRASSSKVSKTARGGSSHVEKVRNLKRAESSNPGPS